MKIFKFSVIGLTFLVSLTASAASAQLKNLEKDFICTEGYTSNLRSDPDLNSAVVTQLSKYTPLEVLEEKDLWVKVKTKSFQGWIYHTLISRSINCALALKSYKTHKSYTSRVPHRYREQVLTGEGFRILKTEVGMTQVKDKTGNVFWLENHILWPKNKLESLSL